MISETTHDAAGADEVVLFLDTNILLHYPPLKDIDWHTVASAKRVRLVICRQVVDELDAKKDHPLLSRRAQRAISEIDEWSGTEKEIRPGVTVEDFGCEVSTSELVAALGSDAPDLRIVYLFKEFEEQNPGIVGGVVTEDRGMRLRCSTHGVSSYEADQSWRLETPRSELEKKVFRLRKQVAQMDARSPNICLCVTHKHGKPKPHEPLVCEVKAEHRLLDIQAMVREEIAEVGPHVDYIDKFRKYLEELDAHGQLLSRMLVFELHIVNNGTCPAEDVCVVVSFPHSLFVVDTVESERGSWFFKKPEAPERPRPMPLELLRQFDPLRSAKMMQNIKGLPEAFSELMGKSPTIEVTELDDGTREVRITIGLAKHGIPSMVGTFVAAFGAAEDIGVFETPYELHAANLPNKKDGKLVFKVTKKG
jgi:hypothetical protein